MVRGIGYASPYWPRMRWMIEKVSRAPSASRATVKSHVTITGRIASPPLRVVAGDRAHHDPGRRYLLKDDLLLCEELDRFQEHRHHEVVVQLGFLHDLGRLGHVAAHVVRRVEVRLGCFPESHLRSHPRR